MTDGPQDKRDDAAIDDISQASRADRGVDPTDALATFGDYLAGSGPTD
jgi:hypothetical protein